MKPLPLTKWIKSSRKQPSVGDNYYCMVTERKGDRPLKMIVEWAQYPNGNWDWALEDYPETTEDSIVIAWLEELPQNQTEG